MSRKRFCAICKTFSHKILHRFPREPYLRDVWIDNTGIVPKNDADIDTRICSIHFAPEHWYQKVTHNGKGRGTVIHHLKDDAYPTLYVFDRAPVADPRCTVPTAHIRKTDRCAVCYSAVYVASAVDIFDKNDYYTDFGVALSFLLKMSSRELSSRFCCTKCSDTVLKCFGLAADVNVSVMLTLRAAEARRRMVEENRRTNAKVGANPDEEYLIECLPKESPKSVIEVAEKEFYEECYRCQGDFESLEKFTDHFIMHLFLENREVYSKSVAMTQVDEFELDTDLYDEFAEREAKEKENVILPAKRAKNKKLKVDTKTVKLETDRIELPIDVDSPYVVEYLDDECLGLSLGGPDDSFVDIGGTNIKQSHRDDYDPVFVSEDEGAAAPNVVEVPISSKVLLAQSEAEAIMKLQKKRAKTLKKNGAQVCHLCGKTLKNQKIYDAHMERHANPDKFYSTCGRCGMRVTHMSRHKASCEKNPQPSSKRTRKFPPVNCDVCGKAVAGAYLPRHMRRHEIEADIAKNGESAREKYLQTCAVCGKRVLYMYEHRQVHKKRGELIEPPITDPEPFVCNICGKVFPQRTLLVNHLALKHGLDPRTMSSRGMKTNWTCSICKTVFLTYNAIRAHTLDEHNGLGCDLQCEVCGKQYNSKSSYIFHINSRHLGYYKYRCKNCGNFFVEEKSYNAHMLYRCKVANSVKKSRKGAPQSSEMVQIQEVVMESTEFLPNDILQQQPGADTEIIDGDVYTAFEEVYYLPSQ